MMRAVVLGGALAAWGAFVGVSVYILTPDQEAEIAAAAGAELDASLRTVVAATAEIERELLANVREAAQMLRPGLALDAGGGDSAAKPKKKTAPVDATIDTEAARDRMRTLEVDLSDALLPHARWIALLNKTGEVVFAAGSEGWPLGTQMKNHPLFLDAIMGISRLGASGDLLLAVAPTVGRDGGANGAIIAARAVDASLCEQLSKQAHVAVAIGRACKTGPLPAASVGAAVLPAPSPDVPFFVDAARVGYATLGGDRLLPGLDMPVAVATDLRPAYARLGAWQQRLASIWMLGLVPLIILLILAWTAAAAPAQVIANHLALLQQGNKVAPLQERKFSGGFKRVVKNLNATFERRESRAPQQLQPISALLQQQAIKDEISGEFKLDAITEVGPRARPEAAAATSTPPVATAPAPSQPAPVQPPLAPLSALSSTGLSSLSDAIFEEPEKTVTARIDALDLAALRDGPSKQDNASRPATQPGIALPASLGTAGESTSRPATQPAIALPTGPAASAEGRPATQPAIALPASVTTSAASKKTVSEQAVALPAAPPASSAIELPGAAAQASISKLQTLSDSEAESGVGRIESTQITRIPTPPPAPVDSTPWPESPAALPPLPPADPDEAHFQEVFTQFLKVREQCGEPTDNLTFDKFVDKLKKSRDQVMQKQHTRNVRFQVYVKDGKAALKAVAAARAD